MTKTDTITPFQLFSITLFSMLFGIRIYPSTIEHDIKYDWLAAQLITGVLIFLILLMSVKIFSNTDFKSFSEAIINLTGNIPSRILCGFICVYFILQSLILILLESKNIQLFLFDRTPILIISSVILITAYVLTISGLRPLARLTELLATPIIITLIIMLIICLSGSDFGETKALFQPSGTNMLSQIKKAISCFFSIEITAFFISRATERKKAGKALLFGYSVCFIIMLLLTLSIAGTFTLYAGSELIYPVTELARTVQLKYLRLIERLDTVMIAVSITNTCIFTSLSCYCASESLSICLKPLKIRYSIFVYAVLFILLLFGINAQFFDAVAGILLWTEAAILFLIIPALYIISNLKKKGAANDSI